MDGSGGRSSIYGMIFDQDDIRNKQGQRRYRSPLPATREKRRSRSPERRRDHRGEHTTISREQEEVGRHGHKRLGDEERRDRGQGQRQE